MKRIAVIVTGPLALVGCGGDDGKPTCSATRPCAARNYCAETPDGNVCWPDEDAVIVDGRLDTSAPWPKAYHDPQNTSNAGVMP